MFPYFLKFLWFLQFFEIFYLIIYTFNIASDFLQHFENIFIFFNFLLSSSFFNLFTKYLNSLQSFQYFPDFFNYLQNILFFKSYKYFTDFLFTNFYWFYRIFRLDFTFIRLNLCIFMLDLCNIPKIYIKTKDLSINT